MTCRYEMLCRICVLIVQIQPRKHVLNLPGYKPRIRQHELLSDRTDQESIFPGRSRSRSGNRWSVDDLSVRAVKVSKKTPTVGVCTTEFFWRSTHLRSPNNRISENVWATSEPSINRAVYMHLPMGYSQVKVLPNNVIFKSLTISTTHQLGKLLSLQGLRNSVSERYLIPGTYLDWKRITPGTSTAVLARASSGNSVRQGERQSPCFVVVAVTCNSGHIFYPQPLQPSWDIAASTIVSHVGQITSRYCAKDLDPIYHTQETCVKDLDLIDPTRANIC